MKKANKILKGIVLSAFAVLVFSGAVFATAEDCNSAYPNLYFTETDASDGTHTVKCGSKTTLSDGSSYYVYGEHSSDCAQLGSIAGNPEACKSDSLNNIVAVIINTMIFAIGMVAVIMIILGGISYATSQGDPQKVKKGKDTILYGIIGLVVALLAFAIVNFVLGALNG